MTHKRIITVFGATGAQGGGLAKAILNDPTSEFAVRALTRDPGSERSRELQSMGAEIIKLDLSDGYGAVLDALKGAYGAFFVTFFWNHLSAERETREAEQMARAAREAGIKHAVWSTLEDTRDFVPLVDDRMPTLMEKFKVPHFDGKGEADRYFIQYGVPTTFLLASFYWENFIHFGMGPKRFGNDTLELTLPLRDKKMAGIASEDIGKCAYGIFKEGPILAGKRIGVSGEHLSGTELAAKLSRRINQDVKYNPTSASAFRQLGFPAAEDLGNMFQFYDEFESAVNATRSVEASRRLNPHLQDFDTWLNANAGRIPLS